MLYDLYKNVCSLVVKVLNIQIPWSANVHPTIAQVIVFTLISIVVINFIRGLME